MLKQESRTIGGHVYKVRQLPATQGRKLMLMLAKVLVPAMGSGKGANGLGDALDRLTEADFETVCNVLAESTDVVIQEERGTREPKLSRVFDLHFAGNYLEMFEWLKFALEVNFANFYEELKAKAPPLVAGTAAQEPSSD